MDLLSLQLVFFPIDTSSVLAEAEPDISLLGKLGSSVSVFNADCGISQVLETQMETHGSSYQQMVALAREYSGVT